MLVLTVLPKAWPAYSNFAFHEWYLIFRVSADEKKYGNISMFKRDWYFWFKKDKDLTAVLCRDWICAAAVEFKLFYALSAKAFCFSALHMDLFKAFL